MCFFWGGWVLFICCGCSFLCGGGCWWWDVKYGLLLLLVFFFFFFLESLGGYSDAGEICMFKIEVDASAAFWWLVFAFLLWLDDWRGKELVLGFWDFLMGK